MPVQAAILTASGATNPTSTSAKGKAPASAADLAALRLQEELLDILANPIRFKRSEFRPTAVRYTAVNEQHNAPSMEKPGYTTPSKVQQRASSEASTSSQAMRPRAGSDGGADNGDRNGGSGAPASPTKRSELYAHKLSFRMPHGVRPRAAGLMNRGNTCYMNSTLQGLLHLPPLAFALLTQSEEELLGRLAGSGPRNFPVMRALRVLADKVLRQPNSVVSPLAFTQHLKAFAPTLRPHRQEDAHEFLRFLLEALQHNCTSAAPKSLSAHDPLRRTTLVGKLFGGTLRSRVKCRECRHNSDTFEAMMDLSLDLRPDVSTITQAIEAFTEADVLKGRERYKCDKCKRLVNAEKRFTIHETPTILTIHLKRFKMTGGKITRPIGFRETLVLPRHCLSEVGDPATPEVKYRLFAVVSHLGNGPHSGHYVADVRAPKGSTAGGGGGGGEWLSMNDDYVSRASGPPDARHAYILFYVRDAAASLQAALLRGGDAESASATKKRRLSDGRGLDRGADDEGRAAKKRPAQNGALPSSSSYPSPLRRANATATPPSRNGMVGAAARPLSTTSFHGPTSGGAGLARDPAASPSSRGVLQSPARRDQSLGGPSGRRADFVHGGHPSVGPVPSSERPPRLANGGGTSAFGGAGEEDLGEALEEQRQVEAALSGGGVKARGGEYESLVGSSAAAVGGTADDDGKVSGNGLFGGLSRKQRRRLKQQQQQQQLGAAAASGSPSGSPLPSKQGWRGEGGLQLSTSPSPGSAANAVRSDAPSLAPTPAKGRVSAMKPRRS